MKGARKDRLIREKIHDPYYEDRKYPDGVMCPDCRAIYQNGHWLWPKDEEKMETAAGDRHLCPGCRRIQDRHPAGVVYLEGEYLSKRRKEILNLIDRIVREEQSKSPLKKVMSREEEGDRISIHLTDDHMARHLGEAIHRAHKGDLKIKYGEEARFVRIYWSRNLPEV
jgi:NMD protein affecting ribosome stability and mRNA decay